MIRALALSAMLFAAIGVALPAAAADDAAELAEQRLRGCLLAGSSAAPQAGLREAVISVRSFCTPQIKRVQGDRVKAATTGLSGEARKAAEESAIRALNDEVALAIATFTGLTS